MEIDPVSLLTIKDVGTVGLLLAFIALSIVGLKTEAIVTGARWKEKIKACDDLSEALRVATAENKQCESDYTESRVSLARLEERERLAKGGQSRGRGASS